MPKFTLEHLTDDEIDILKEEHEKLKATHPSWLTILTIDSLHGTGPENYDDMLTSLFYFSIIQPNEKYLMSINLTYSTNKINELIDWNIKKEKAKRIKLFLENILKEKAGKLDKLKKL